MTMTSAARGQAIYNKIASGPNFSKLSAAEQNALLAQIQAIWGDGDLAYIKQNAAIVPGSFQTPAGAAVATAGSATAQTGTVTAPTPLSGIGQVT